MRLPGACGGAGLVPWTHAVATRVLVDKAAAGACPVRVSIASVTTTPDLLTAP